MNTFQSILGSDGDLTLRFATLEDAEALLEIYAPYISQPVTFEYEVPPLEEFRHRIIERIAFYPYLVMEADGAPVGYAYASRYKARPGYQWDVELSVYVGQNCRGRGVGRKLYAALLTLLKMQGVRNAFGIVSMPNVGSMHLHRKMGFRVVGIQYRAGYKCGEWHDVLIFQKEMGDFDAEPQPIIPVAAFEPSTIESVLKGALDGSLKV